MNNETILSVGDALRKLAKVAKDLLFDVLYNYEPFKKHMHYAIHAKKERVRKKHINIMRKYIRKEVT